MKDKRKTKRANLESQRSIFMKIGFIVSLALVFLGFEWKQHHLSNHFRIPKSSSHFEEELIINTLREEPPPPPKEQPQSQSLKVVDDDVEVNMDFHINVEHSQNPGYAFPEPPEVDDKEVVEKRTFIAVQNPPAFPGGEAARLQYLKENIIYPEMAKKVGIEGIVYVSFVVNSDGSVVNAEIQRGIGSGCDQEALRVVQNMPQWSPGKQRGRPVNVQMSMPIQFVLE